MKGFMTHQRSATCPTEANQPFGLRNARPDDCASTVTTYLAVAVKVQQEGIRVDLKDFSWDRYPAF
jgi:hypothetical protein